ncbi:MAG: hypothetical protein ACOCT9_00600, partial [archaeon]
MEVKSKRTKHKKVYDMGDGAFEVENFADPIHYKENGEWKEIDLNIKETDEDYAFKVEKNALKAFFKDDPTENNTIKFKAENGYIEFTPVCMRYRSGKDINVLAEPKNNGVDVDDNNIKYKNEFPNIDDEFVVEHEDIKDNLIIKELPEPPKEEDSFLEFVDKIDLNGSLVSDGRIIDFHHKTKSEIEIRNFRGQHVFTIPKLKIFEKDDQNNYIIGEYEIKFKEDGIYLISRVPCSYLFDDERKLPIIVDPNTTIKAEYETGNLARVDESQPDKNFFEYDYDLIKRDEIKEIETLDDAGDLVRS